MSTKRTTARAGLVALVALGALTAAQSPAGADPAPTATDVVGVGSDVVQSTLDFLADGDIHGNPGYNTAGNKNRLVSFDATADGNGRNAFTDPSLSTSVALNPTVVLRAGTSPVQRPNGGSAGLAALLADGTGSKALISFVRSPNLPTAAQQTTAEANLGGPLHTVQFAKDDQVIATASTTNAPSALSAQELVSIYDGQVTTWNQLPGNSAGSTDTIIPLIPQNGAGVRTIFLNALKAANGGTAITLGGNVRSVQQNDPTTITGLSAADQKDAIVPFPVGRYDLLNSGYFLNPNTPYSSTSPAAPLTTAGIALQQGGTPGDGNTTFDATIPYYVIFRESDFASTTAWQPGSTLNWVQTLFLDPGGPAPFVDSAPGQAIIQAAGVTPLYADLGNQTSG